MWNWCKKVGRKAREIGKKTWGWTKSTVVGYAWPLLQDGFSRGHALIEALRHGTNLVLKTPVAYSLVLIHGSMTVARIGFKKSTGGIKWLLREISEKMQKATAKIPLLVVIGVGLEFEPTTLAIMFGGSVLLSATHGILNMTKKNLAAQDRELSKSERALVNIYDNGIDPFTSVLVRAGQGALGKRTISTLIRMFAYEQLANEKDATSSWLTLFVYIPGLLEVSRLILRRAYPDSIGVKNFSTFIVGFFKMFESSAFLSVFLGQTDAVIRGTSTAAAANIPIEDAFIIDGFSIGLGGIRGAQKGYNHHKKITEEQEARRPRIVEIDVETGEELATFDSHSDSDTDSARSTSPHIARSMFSQQPQRALSAASGPELERKLLGESRRERDSNADTSSSDYSPPPIVVEQPSMQPC